MAGVCTSNPIADSTIQGHSLEAVRQQAMMRRGVATHKKQCGREGCEGEIVERPTNDSEVFRHFFWWTWPLHCSFATMDCQGGKGCLCNPIQGCCIDCQGGSGPAKITTGVCSICGDETKWTYEGHPWGEVTLARPYEPSHSWCLWMCCPRRLIKVIPGLTEKIRVSSDFPGS